MVAYKPKQRDNNGNNNKQLKTNTLKNTLTNDNTWNKRILFQMV